MPRPIWKGHISFGLVNIPVTLYSAEVRSDLHFKLVDGRNHGAVRYERHNEITGEEVPWNEIVKGYEHEDGEFVLLTDEDFKQAAPEATESVEIEDFVPQDAIAPEYFDKPYYLIPTKGGQKSYALLRETMRKMNRVGIARVVIRTREYIAALMVRDRCLMLNLLRYQQELREIPVEGLPEAEKVTDKELAMAEQLVETMSGDWKPASYEDEYRKALMKYIDGKLAKGQTATVPHAEEEESPEAGNTIDMVEMLRRSMAERAKSKPKPADKKKAHA